MYNTLKIYTASAIFHSLIPFGTKIWILLRLYVAVNNANSVIISQTYIKSFNIIQFSRVTLILIQLWWAKAVRNRSLPYKRQFNCPTVFLFMYSFPDHEP